MAYRLVGKIDSVVVPGGDTVVPSPQPLPSGVSKFTPLANLSPCLTGTYVPPGHSLNLTFTSTDFSYSFRVAIRYMLPDGRIQNKQDDFSEFNQTAFGEQFYWELPECFLLGVTMQNFLSNAGQGHLYGQFDLYLGNPNTGNLVQRLVANYSTNDSFIFWPGGPSQYSDGVPHNEQSISIADQTGPLAVVGTSNNGQFAKFNYLVATLTTSGVAGNRGFRALIWQGDFGSRWFYSSLTVPASTTAYINLFVGNRAEEQHLPDWYFYVDAGYVGGPTDIVRLEIVNEKAGDTLRGAGCSVLNWNNLD